MIAYGALEDGPFAVTPPPPAEGEDTTQSLDALQRGT